MRSKLSPYDLSSGNRIGELRKGEKVLKIIGHNPYTGRTVNAKKTGNTKRF